MKTIRIYTVPSHQTEDRTSGVDFVRVLQPMKYLNGYSDGEVKFEVDFFDIHAKEQPSWPEIAKKYDIVYLNYTVLDWQYAAMGACVHGEGKKIIMDLDDAIWFLRKDNITYQKMQELNGAFLITCMLNDVDGVTTTNKYLRNIILERTDKYMDKVRVFPNSIDFTLYNRTFPAKDTGQITLLHYGSTSHFEDLLDEGFVGGIDKIFSEYPNVKIKFVGAFIQELKYKWGVRYENTFGDTDIYKWISEKFPQFMEEADIIVAPLEDDRYNRAKSELKFLETASAAKPGVFSDVRPYSESVEHGKTGYLASTANEWYESLKTLIDSHQKRIEIGSNAFEYVRAERDIRLLIPEYAEYFKRILTS